MCLIVFCFSLSEMTNLNMVGLATFSLGFITAAYYLLPPVSRYFSRVFYSTRRTEPAREGNDASAETAGIFEDRTSTEDIPEANGAIAQSAKAESSPEKGLDYNSNVLVENGRNGLLIPEDFEHFVSHNMIMKFEGQRQVKFQFFVVVLASEVDLRDLSNMTFHPHDTSSSRQPLIDNSELTMPQAGEYGNYIVARFESGEYHSEEVVFGPKFDNPFFQLWSAYKKKNNGNCPKAILLYSWNFPCGRCTKLIVSELSKEQYRGSHVMLTYSQIWDSEEGYPYVAEKNMEIFKRETGAYIQVVKPPVPLKEAGPGSTT